jgi:hypothetical protein
MFVGPEKQRIFYSWFFCPQIIPLNCRVIFKGRNLNIYRQDAQRRTAPRVQTMQAIRDNRPHGCYNRQTTSEQLLETEEERRNVSRNSGIPARSTFHRAFAKARVLTTFIAQTFAQTRPHFQERAPTLSRRNDASASRGSLPPFSPVF